jgi:solute carrier family 13 (sodium-dependent dicarboxylate transporter), member 2/3/5
MAESVRPGGTYQTLDEQREKLSPAEERFERARQTVGLFLGPLVFLALYLAPLPLEPAQQALAAVFAFVTVYWLTEPIPIPVTAVLALAMYVLFGAASANAVFGAFSSDTIFLFIGAFVIAEAMMRHGLDRRFAFNNQNGPFRGSIRYYRRGPHSARRHGNGPTRRARVS